MKNTKDIKHRRKIIVETIDRYLRELRGEFSPYQSINLSRKTETHLIVCLKYGLRKIPLNDAGEYEMMIPFDQPEEKVFARIKQDVWFGKYDRGITRVAEIYSKPKSR